MDEVWLNRAGILAEAVSFVLIAPEIIGVERLRRIEHVIESALPALVARVVDSKIRPGDPDSKIRPTDILIGTIGTGIFMSLAIGVFYVLSILVPDRVFLAVFWGACAWFLVSMAWLVLRQTDRATKVELIILVLPFLPIGLSLFLLERAFTIFRRLLVGEDRLRALVFGTGVMLLFGGMGTQFVATF